MFSKGWQGCSEGLPEGGARGNPQDQLCQPAENPVLPDSFTQIYILLLIGFRIGPHKMHRRFCIGLPKILRRFGIGRPKIHRRFRIGPPHVFLVRLIQCVNALCYQGQTSVRVAKIQLTHLVIAPPPW